MKNLSSEDVENDKIHLLSHLGIAGVKTLTNLRISDETVKQHCSTNGLCKIGLLTETLLEEK